MIDALLKSIAMPAAIVSRTANALLRGVTVRGIAGVDPRTTLGLSVVRRGPSVVGRRTGGASVVVRSAPDGLVVGRRTGVSVTTLRRVEAGGDASGDRAVVVGAST